MTSPQSGGDRLYAELRGETRAAEMRQLAEGTGAEAALADFALDFVFGKVWSRGVLDRKQRSLMTIAALVTLGHTAELENHVRIGLTNGLEPAEIEEAIVQVAPYAGLPKSWGAARALPAIFARAREGKATAFPTE